MPMLRHNIIGITFVKWTEKNLVEKKFVFILYSLLQTKFFNRLNNNNP